MLTKSVSPVIQAAETAIRDEIDSIAKLSALASTAPYYKYDLTYRESLEIDST